MTATSTPARSADDVARLSSVAQGALRLLFGVDGAVVVVPARHAAILDDAVLGDFRRAHRGDNRELDEVLLAVGWAALHYRNHQAEPGHEQAPISDTQTRYELTTADAAARLRCSDRTVRRAIRAGHLPAHRAGHIWLMDSRDLDHYADQHVQQKGSRS